MADSALSVHWRFAAGQAFAGLLDLVCSFDFLRLTEPEGVVFAGDRAELQRLRKTLAERIQPAHREGLAAGGAGTRVITSTARCQGRNCIGWPCGRLLMTRCCGAGSPRDSASPIRLRRWNHNDEMLRGWFAEGFCVAYSFEKMESRRSESDP
jgi:hypothetical protein